MDSMFSLMDLIILGSGAYVLYCYYLLKFKGEIKEGLLLPKGTNVKKCTDKAAYTREVENKVLVYGIVVLICGGCGVLETQIRSSLAEQILWKMVSGSNCHIPCSDHLVCLCSEKISRKVLADRTYQCEEIE